MQFNEYQLKALDTAQYPSIKVTDTTGPQGFIVNRLASWVYPAMGLAGETGEVLEKLKKIIRDKHGVYDQSDVEGLTKELGDCLWYISVIANEFGIKLEDVAKTNIDKLASRKERNMISGNGDNR